MISRDRACSCRELDERRQNCHLQHLHTQISAHINIQHRMNNKYLKPTQPTVLGRHSRSGYTVYDRAYDGEGTEARIYINSPTVNTIALISTNSTCSWLVGDSPLIRSYHADGDFDYFFLCFASEGRIYSTSEVCMVSYVIADSNNEGGMSKGLSLLGVSFHFLLATWII